jgi:hypothetical protein
MHTKLIGKYEATRPLGRFKCRQEGNIKMNIEEIGFENVDYIQLVQHRVQWQALVNMVMNFKTP